MALSNDEIALIRSSFRVVTQNTEQAADRLYRILFEIAPEVREMFLRDMQPQGAMLMSKLGLVVSELQHLEALAPMLEDLALRHVAYGVKPEHYPVLGEALLRMLADVVGDDFTTETRAAWNKAYDELATLMIGSAYVD